MSLTFHGHRRAQQRCIPPIVQTWLETYGTESYDGRGGIRLYFSHAGIRAMEKDLGRHFVRENRKYLHAYRVESSHDGAVITSGWRTRKIMRR